MVKVSIVMPAYNAEQYISIAIHSAQSQSMPDWELIIVDDCSTDATRQLAQEIAEQDPKIMLLCHEHNCGVAQARNTALQHASGEYIAFLDCDDIWHNNKLELQLAYMAQTDADLCYTSYAFIDNFGNSGKTYRVPSCTSYRALLAENVIGCSTVLLKATSLNGLCFSPDYFHEDYLLWLALLKRGIRAVGIQEVLTRYRIGGRSFNKFNSAHNRWIIYRRVEKLPFFCALCYFVRYSLNGLRKHHLRN